MTREVRKQSNEDAETQSEEATLADQALEVIGSLTYCTEERLDQILRHLPGMATYKPQAFGGVRGFSDRRESSDADLAAIGADFAVYMAQAVLLVHLGGEAVDRASPAETAHLRRVAARRATEDGRPHILLLIGGDGPRTTIAPSVDLAPLCNLQWSDIANAVRRLPNLAGVERRLLAQLCALPDTRAKAVATSTLKSLQPFRIAHAQFPVLSTSRIAGAPTRTGNAEARQSCLRPLSRPGITTTILGRIQ